MPRILRFHGASDDLFECEAVIAGSKPSHARMLKDEPDEIGCEGGAASVIIQQPSYEPGSGAGLRVAGLYGDGGVWTIGVGPIDEGIAIPPWPCKFMFQPGATAPPASMRPTPLSSKSSAPTT